MKLLDHVLSIIQYQSQLIDWSIIDRFWLDQLRTLRMIDIMPKIESMLEEFTTLNIEIGAVVSDNASGYAAIR